MLARSIAFALATSVATTAHAFCGFYVAQGDKKLTNDATMVVMLRDGTRTVLSMQNDYAGPPEDFALVVPVPVVLQKENVKTLERSLFDRVDLMTAPRLVEYWEQDPCPPEDDFDEAYDDMEGGTGTRASSEEGGEDRFATQVKVEAKFAVAEYEVVILSATDAFALDGWLKEHRYRIPEGAEPVLRPYVAAGSKFFVARVDATKVPFENGRARLSPLRFHYDSDTFTLPVRLGLLNASGHQDLVVNIIGRKRFDVVNYPRATMPTNIEIEPSAMGRLPEIHAALFDAVQAKTPNAVVTEYAWNVASCDPCPGPVLSESELDVLGLDVVPKRGKSWARDWVVTRLHARYTKDQLGPDLVFAEAAPIDGGHEGSGPEAVQAKSDAFQTRYVTRHLWTGPITCSEPVRGTWGGPPVLRGKLPLKVRDPLVARGKLDLPSVLRTPAASVGVVAKATPPRTTESPPRERRLGMGALLGFALAATIVAVTERRRAPT
jgi:hypothetical protein